MNKINRSAEQSHNYGIDLLRIVAMWMICSLHVLNRGGVYGSASSSVFSWLQPLQIVVMCGVNMYAQISGYVTVYGRFRPSRVLTLWLQVLFWNLVIAAFGELMQPHIMDEFWLRYCFPLTQKCFWYFTAYVGVYAFSPLINRGILALRSRQCRALFWAMFLLFSLGTNLGYANQGDPWGIGAGYNVLWLLALYVMGACVRHGRLGNRLAWWQLLLIAALCVTGLSLMMNLLPKGNDAGLLVKNLRKHFYDYHSPWLAIFSVCMLLLFSKLRIGEGLAKQVRFFAPLSFGVYIIHVHHVNWVWIENLYKPLAKLAPPLALLSVLAAALGLFLVCALLDRLRAELFRMLRVRSLCEKLEQGFLARLNRPEKE